MSAASLVFQSKGNEHKTYLIRGALVVLGKYFRESTNLKWVRPVSAGEGILSRFLCCESFEFRLHHDRTPTPPGIKLVIESKGIWITHIWNSSTEIQEFANMGLPVLQRPKRQNQRMIAQTLIEPFEDLLFWNALNSPAKIPAWEAFSCNLTHDSFPLPSLPTGGLAKYVNQRFLSYWVGLLSQSNLELWMLG